MSADSPANDGPTARLPLIDVLEAIGDELEHQRETAELVDLGSRAMFADLRMALQAECAARGIDWNGLLAAAVRRGLQPPSIMN